MDIEVVLLVKISPAEAHVEHRAVMPVGYAAWTKVCDGIHARADVKEVPTPAPQLAVPQTCSECGEQPAFAGLPWCRDCVSSLQAVRDRLRNDYACRGAMCQIIGSHTEACRREHEERT